MYIRRINSSISQKVFSILFLVIISFYVYNQITWKHLHYLPDGTIITHSHPFNKTTDTSPVKNHHHSQADYFALQLLEFLFLSALIALLWVCRLEEFEKLFLPPVIFETTYHLIGNGRSPPFSIY